ncbi:uncharacterized protein K02A2.6-like [Mercenaria mercenaria]|uniref:uncharacterized protein K02A2.6-like n=1 Tax=Mercenaria mercenaria TaxID=6596 RepID=UPI00234F90AA|nr:uncharacterized protein K02A2.6-like [Mercenaria mercenaria]
MRKGKVPLFGREWLYALKLNWTEIWNLNLDRVAQFKNKYKDVFDRDLGKVKNFKAKLKLKPESTPKFVKARKVPFVMKPQIEEELDRLVKDGVLEKVDTSEWATPIVPVPKKEGIRICGDFKVTINPLFEVDQHPLPKIEDIFASLGKAPAIFQRLIEQAVGDSNNVEVILDDTIVTGQDDNEHLETLEKVQSRLSEYGLKMNVEKCAFMNDKVVFCAHDITKDGLHKTTEKINAIKDAPPIKNVRDLRSFLGQNLATVLHPLHQLLSNIAKWKSTKACQDVVAKVKEMITSDLVLINYDPDLPIILACGASSFGIGTVLSHKLPNSTERPIAFASRSLN